MKQATLFIAVLLVLFFTMYNTYLKGKKDRELDSKDALIAALGDSLKLTRNEDSSLKASISVLQTSKTKDFLSLQTKDKEVQELQDLVKEYQKDLTAGSSVTKGLIETIATLKQGGTVTITHTDTVYQDDVAVVFPTYVDSISNKWIKLVGKMSKDTSQFSLKVNNEFSAIVGSHKLGLFKKRVPFVDLNMSNPYSTVKELRSYQVSIPPQKRWGIGPVIGYGLNSQFKGQVFIGAGLQYNIIRL